MVIQSKSLNFFGWWRSKRARKIKSFSITFETQNASTLKGALKRWIQAGDRPNGPTEIDLITNSKVAYSSLNSLIFCRILLVYLVVYLPVFLLFQVVELTRVLNTVRDQRANYRASIHVSRRSARVASNWICTPKLSFRTFASKETFFSLPNFKTKWRIQLFSPWNVLLSNSHFSHSLLAIRLKFHFAFYNFNFGSKTNLRRTNSRLKFGLDFRVAQSNLKSEHLDAGENVFQIIIVSRSYICECSPNDNRLNTKRWICSLSCLLAFRRVHRVLSLSLIPM